MEKTTYKDNEKVLYKTRCRLSLRHKEPEEVDCLVTQGHVVIEAEEPIKVPVSHIQDCLITAECCATTSCYGQTREPLCGTVTLSFRDSLNKKRRLSLEVPVGSMFYFKEAIKEANR